MIAGEHYDVVIAGGGMVGLSLASALATASASQCRARKKSLQKASPLRILVVDRMPMKGVESPSYHPSFDARATALSLASIDIYREMGVLDNIIAHSTPIRTIHVSDRGHSGSSVMRAEEESVDAFGYVVENQWLGSVLLASANAATAVELCGAASVQAARPVASGYSVTIATSVAEQPIDSAERGSGVAKGATATATVTTSLLVVADGAESALRSALGIDAETTPYAQSAVVANVQTQLPHRGCAFERFTADGAVALLPLVDSTDESRRSSLVWTLPRAEAEQLIADSDDRALRERLQCAFGQRLGRITRIGRCHAYPLSLTVSSESVRSHLVIMGNAAHALHPIAGQGFNLALRDVAVLVECLMHALDKGQTIGQLEDLESYSSRQVDDQRITIGFSHRLIQLFGEQALPIQAGRSLGLLALDLLPPAKSAFVRRAAGTAGRQARWSW